MEKIRKAEEMIKNNKSTKEIAAALSIGESTVRRFFPKKRRDAIKSGN